MVAGGVEEVPTVRGVDIEEDSWDHDRSFLQELFEEGLLIVLQKKRKRFTRPVLAFGFGGVREVGGVGRTRPLFKGGGRLSKFNQI